METKFTPAPWTADLRGGCCAIYPSNRSEDTQCCASDDPRNICYSRKDAHYNGNHWEMCKETQANFVLMAAAPKLYNMLRNIEQLIGWGYANSELVDALHDYKTEIAEVLAEARGESQSALAERCPELSKEIVELSTQKTFRVIKKVN